MFCISASYRRLVVTTTIILLMLMFSRIVVPFVRTEDKLSQSNVELLVSYLTAPYLRIPLVLHFFASPENINALGLPILQDVLDGVLFEPGLWQPPNVQVKVGSHMARLGAHIRLTGLPLQLPDKIPCDSRAHLATPVGLLLNELQKSPQVQRGLLQSSMACAERRCVAAGHHAAALGLARVRH